MKDKEADKGLVPEAEDMGVRECWDLLRQSHVGRLGVVSGGRPDIFPVNYQVKDETLIFRTGSGTKLQAIHEAGYVALETDTVSTEFGFAWSVVVKGPAEAVEDPGKTLNKVSRALFPWQGIGHDQLVRISPESVTGRRFTLPTAVKAWTDLDVATRAGLE
ncbi:MAG TPA: pyridoxamine 5'-phosphate oxidase family protein [Micrococcaceae bacterium]|jgi:nitroimidazol reductase NimA-like FMN-containing flavoprotein (pyridoxamine 5'-phosphate oxidase superfamily)|nr:pyridoxamine 5'-phosphate oxidase family protein [Micrococcaceae bacterium]